MIPKSGHRFSEKIMLNKSNMIALWPARLIAATAAIALFMPAALFARDGVDWITKFPRRMFMSPPGPVAKKSR